MTSPKELNSLQAELKRLDINISSLNESRDLYKHKLEKLNEMNGKSGHSLNEKTDELNKLKIQIGEFHKAI